MLMYIVQSMTDPLSVAPYLRLWKVILASLHPPKITFHDMRHSALQPQSVAHVVINVRAVRVWVTMRKRKMSWNFESECGVFIEFLACR